MWDPKVSSLLNCPSSLVISFTATVLCANQAVLGQLYSEEAEAGSAFAEEWIVGGICHTALVGASDG